MTGVKRVGQAGIACAIPILALLGPQGASATTPAQAATLPAANTPAPAKPATGIPPAARHVSYNGLQITVPASWPVIDLRSDPSACIRLDHNGLYLGSPGPTSNCPAHVVGRADTIWLTTAATGQPAQQAQQATNQTKVGALTARVATDTASHDTQIQFAATGTQLRATWGPDPSTINHVLASAVPSNTPTTAAPIPTPQKPTPQQVSPAAVAPALTGGTTFTGMAFDTCAAPSASSMHAWLSSPYRGVAVYIGGSMRACGDGNLSASWVAQVHAMGWRLIPTYVGPQAPCVNQSGLATINPSTPTAQGIANADDAVARAKYFGMSPGTPLYYDMEGYSPSASCSRTVVSFLSAWTSQLHHLGYKSGAYGNPGSLMTDMSHAAASRTMTPPDNIWFAHWNGLKNTSDQASYPAFPNSDWNDHQRLHQYEGNLNQAWGGVGISIDADWVDGGVAGTPTLAATPPPIGSPFGHIDAVSTASGKVSASGWAIDPNTRSPIMVQMYVDYRTNVLTWASRARPDIGRAYPSYGPNHGYALTMAATPGAHTVCLYAINTGPGASTGLGCRVVNVSSSPFGQIDAVSTASSKVSAAGWAIDPNTQSPILVQMYVDYRTNVLTRASRARPDIGRAYPSYGPNHGYALTMAATPGAHTVCLYAINTGPGASTGLGCRVVRVP